jgi:hypothetical protein
VGANTLSRWESAGTPNRTARLDAGHVLLRVVDQQIDVLGETPRAVSNHGEPADEQVTRLRLVQGSADADDVARLRRSRVAIIILVIHASASSKEEKKKTPRGTSAASPRRNAAVRARLCWSGQPRPSIDLRPTDFTP